MLPALTALFLCQLAGEIVVQTLGLTFPGPVLGMGLLFVLLLWRGHSDGALDTVSNGLLSNLSLLFVPASVGIIEQGGLIAENWLALLAALVLSCIVTLAVTAWVFQAVARRMERGA